MQQATRVLLVEDNPLDVRLFREAAKDLRFDLQVHVAMDGERAVVLAQQVDPDLIVLNLNLPKLSGIEVLRELRADHRTQLVPVVIYSMSNLPGEVTEAYRAGANCAVEKPRNFDACLAAVHDICTFWLERAILPEHTTVPA